MPLTYRKWHSGQTQIGIWQMEEPDEWFELRMDLSITERSELLTLSEKKRREWLASRWLLHLLLDQKQRIFTQRDQFGKLFLHHSQLNISLSHSSDLVAVVVSSKACGIDIQHYTPKIERIAGKFMSSEETVCLDNLNRETHLTIFWGAKESLYKAYGKKELAFQNNILITPFNLITKEGSFSGSIRKHEFEADYQVFYQAAETYALTYCLEK